MGGRWTTTEFGTKAKVKWNVLVDERLIKR